MAVVNYNTHATYVASYVEMLGQKKEQISEDVQCVNLCHSV